MAPQVVKMAYYSPTHTTQRVLAAIVEGLQLKTVIDLDLTALGAAARSFPDSKAALALLGAPVYAGRLPSTAVARLRQLQGNGAPAVIVVVYGNRAYEDALLELSDLAVQAGFVPVAAGAFIGEHSYATQSTPIAVGRPDAHDRELAVAFGREIRARLCGPDIDKRQPLLHLPGNRPYRTGMHEGDVAPITQGEACTRCGICVDVCPVGAIQLSGDIRTDGLACTLCCACVKACPSGARVMLDEGVLRTAQWLATEHSARKEPELFLP